ncbi:S41 family peptidase [Bdellovibrio sp. KM01]|uniref:S41 family peptidase n=1 Tax=Bdellovibrio sp. KM01 TaxID=2748865 RepID=UPI0015E9002B|nr:S41 family peptidase [Bdellovibrio sp. KM01]QLY25777.1 hypothetical protein HW988_01640 [Bdellovibrio sp. KM01]
MKSFAKKYKWMIIVFLSLSASICYFQFNQELSPKDLEVSRIDFSDRKEVLTSKDIDKEIKYLLYAFDHAYSAKSIYPDQYQRMIDELQLLSATKNMAMDEYLNKLQKIFSIIPDGHLRVSRIESDDSSLESARAPSSVFSDPVLSLDPHKVAVKQIPSFIMEEKDIRDLIGEVEKDMQKSKALVFDLRGNSGGYVEVPLKIAALLWGEQYREGSEIQYFPMPIKRNGKIGHPVIHALGKNHLILFQTERGKRIDAEARRGMLQKILDYNEYEYGGTVKKLVYDEYAFQPTNEYEDNNLTYENSHLKDRGYNRPIYIVIDETCASACERFLEAMEEHPHAKTIGSRNTRGCVQFGNVGLLVLPESHLAVSISANYISYKDGRIVENIGYKPQLLLKDSEDPFQRISTLIK